MVLKAEHYHLQDWPPGEADEHMPILERCYDRAGWFLGLFENNQQVGVAVLDSRFIGHNQNHLQLMFLHISNGYRQKGFGKQLFELAKIEASKRGAQKMYISATPSENTVDFYLHLGCKISSEPNPELFELEPEDIHMEYDL